MKTAARYLSCSVSRWLRVLALFSTLAGWLFTPSFFASPAHAAPTTPIGATAGSFSVDGNGGANYSIPIAIPPGTAGMAPSLALSYNQQIDSGILAKGWSVSGLSVISRCGRTIPLDGQKGGVSYDDNDRFCIDGQRLVAINNGTYGANGTEYRTERESFSKIISYRDAAFTGKGPQSFRVWTASGSIMEYGLTSDARIEAQGRTDNSVRLWALNKVQDRAGNYFTVSYYEDTPNGEYHPTRIEYTGNANAALTPYNSIQFVYVPRPDVVFRSQGAAVMNVTQRLTNVQIYAGIALVRDYRLAYDNNGVAGRSRLMSITECSADGVCLPPTMLGWQASSIGVQNWTWTGGQGIGDQGWRVADLFGDGRPVYYTHGSTPIPNLNTLYWACSEGTTANGTCLGIWVTRNSGPGTFLGYVKKTADPGTAPLYWACTAAFPKAGCASWVLRNTPGLTGTQFLGYVLTTPQPGTTTLYWACLAKDLRGTCTSWAAKTTPGLTGTQFVGYIYTSTTVTGVVNSGTHYATRLNPDGTVQNWTWTGGAGLGNAGWQMVDLFGDGRQVYYTLDSNGTHYATRLNSDGTVQNWTWTGGQAVGDSGWQLADLFGDGRPVYWTHNANGQHFATRLNPDSTVTNWAWNGQGVGDSGWQLADLFGEGRQVYWTHSANGLHLATRFNPDNTSQSWTWNVQGVGDSGWQLADLFGDGRLVYWTHSANGLHRATRFNPDNSSQSWSWSGQGVGDSGWQLADLFGEGRQVYWTHSANGLHLATRFNPDNSSQSWSWSGHSVGDSGWQLADLFGEGRQVYWTHNANGQHLATRFNPDNSSQSWTWSGQGVGTNGWQLADLFGNGWQVYWTHSGSTHYATQFSSVKPDLLASITNGLGAKTTVTYKPITDNTVYAKDTTSAVYPYQDIQNATYVVSRYTVSDGLGGEHGASYQYAGAKTHLQGGGWLGFREVKTTDERTGITTTTQYNQVYDGAQNLPAHSETHLGAALISSQDNFWSVLTFPSGLQKFAKLDGTLVQNFELDGSLTTCAQVNNTYDNFGSVTQMVAKTDTACGFTSALTKTTASTYSHDPDKWILGQVLRTTVKSEAPGQTAQTRTVAYTYSTATGYVASDITEPDQTAFRVTTTYTHDSFGNKTRIEVSGADFPTRASTSTYDARGQFPVSSSNALNQSETRVFDPKWGVVTSITGPNGFTATSDYDGFGRPVSRTSPDGKTVATALALCDGSDLNCPSLAKTKVTMTVTGGGATLPPSTVYGDLLGRTLRTRVTGFDGRLVFQDTEYNNLGQAARSSLPYFSGDVPRWSVPVYDALGRVTTVTAPDGSLSRNTYTGLVTRTTNALGQTLTVTKNAAGQVIRSTDHLGGSTIFAYDVFGNLVRTVDAAGNTTTMQYDLRGRKIAMTDPDMGARSYTYNALSDLLSETDAKTQVTSVTYDLLSRVETRTTLEGVSTWAYDTQPKGIGKPATVTGPNGYQETFSYDALGRPASVQTTIQGTAYSVTNAYDSLGRLDTLTYPTGFKVKNVYNNVGVLSEVRDGASNALYWKANSVNEKGQVMSQAYGNGLVTDRVYDVNTGLLQSIRAGSGGAVQSLDYQFDSVGNLISRRDNNQAYTETFVYDGLNRLTQVTGPQSKTYEYDSIGNLTLKSDVGTYLYGAKPHAVTSTAGTVNSTYAYDANGNMLTGANRALTYTSFNKPAQIVANGITTSFNYDPSNNRIVKNNVNGTTVYLGKLYEHLTQGTTVTHKHYVAGVAIVSQTGAATTVRYLHGDHLGSTNIITDETGNVVERLSFDAHGKRRQPNGLDATAPITSLTTRGYTGHEQDDESGLVNMNAREYDPLLGRFLSADTIVPSPLSTQGLNRYSYVYNNPLSFTDPSGDGPIQKWLSIKNITTKTVLAYGPLAPIIANPITLDPGHLTFKASENYVRIKYHEPWLMEDPKRIPYARAAGVAVINYFGGPEAAAMFAGLFDARMTFLMGGDKTAVNQAYIRGSSSTYIMSSASGWASWAGDAVGSAAGSAAADYATQVAIYGVAGGVSAEIQGGDFWQGFASSAAFAMLDIAAREMRTVMIEQSTPSMGCGPNSSGDSVGFWGDGFKLGGARWPGTTSLMGGAQGGQGQFLWMDYAAGSWQDYLVEAFAGPHDYVNSFMYEAGNLSTTFQSGVMGVLGEVASYVNVITATPFVAASVLRPLMPSLSVDLVAPPRY